MPTGNPERKPRRRALAQLVLAYASALVLALTTGWLLRDRHPIVVAAAADLVATIVVFAFSVAHDNSSVYDPYWSVAPLPILLYWAALGARAGAPWLRTILVLLLVAGWSVRLTGNCLARWRGMRDEDFRYREIREKAGRLYWPASLVSIHLMPTIWVFLGLLPVFPALTRPGPCMLLDLAALLLTVAAVAIEATADRQLRVFLRTRRDPEAVLGSGLWARCRHPNYFGEILFWWGLYLFGVAAEPSWAWAGIGPLSITLLFALVSVPWMDRRMLHRHPAWAETMKALPAVLPRIGRNPRSP